MKLLIDILHPAQANFWRHFIKEMEKRGHEIIVTAREKDCTLEVHHAKACSHIENCQQV
jgi:hypothetical protein